MDSSFSLHFTANTGVTSFLQKLIRHIGYDDYIVLALLALGAIFYLSHGILWDKPDPFHYKWFEKPQGPAGYAIETKKNTSNIAEKLEYASKDLVIFWGSQSGTAEGLAHRLARDFRCRLRLEALVADLSDYDHGAIALIPQSKFAIFILSTYGEGDPSDNSTGFLSWLKSNSSGHQSSCLSQLSYAAFGLGNSNYKYYNAVIDAVVTSLNVLGANSLLAVDKANEATGTTEEDFIRWKENLFSVFRSQLGFVEHEPVYEPTLNIVERPSLEPIELHLGTPHPPKSAKSNTLATSPFAPLPITEMRELTTGSRGIAARSCIHLELDLSYTPEVKYKTGDHLAVWPINPYQEVFALLRMLGLEEKKDIPIMLIPCHLESSKLKIPTQTTFLALFQHYLEICAPVSRETTLALTQFAPTPAIKSFLLRLAAEKTAYSTFLDSNHLTFARLLQHSQAADSDAGVSWSELPPSFVIESLRPMQPRYYSICSSSITSPRRVSITVAVSPKPLAKDPNVAIPGLTSTYISSIKARFPVSAEQSCSSAAPLYQVVTSLSGVPAFYASIRRSRFKLPANPQTPLILVAAGTGIAPFRAFLQERARLTSIGRTTGPVLLFFGCRDPEADFLYRSELLDLESGPLASKLEIVTAFSKAPGRPKVYVQDRLVEKRRDLVRMLLEEDAGLYICGAAAMARDVGRCVSDAVRGVQGWDEDALRGWREERKRARRWQEDVWG